MYRDVLDALNACKTTRQHMNAMEKLYKSSAADPRLQALIKEFGEALAGKLLKEQSRANQKAPTKIQKQIHVARAKAERAHKFVPSAPAAGEKMPPAVAALIDYCKSRI